MDSSSVYPCKMKRTNECIHLRIICPPNDRYHPRFPHRVHRRFMVHIRMNRFNFLHHRFVMHVMN